MFYRNITVEDKQYRFHVGQYADAIVVRDESRKFVFRLVSEFSDLVGYDIERAMHKGYWYGVGPRHIEKLIRKYFLGQKVEMKFFTTRQYRSNISQVFSDFKERQRFCLEQIGEKEIDTRDDLADMQVGAFPKRPNAFLVCGDFNKDGGRPSGYMEKFAYKLRWSGNSKLVVCNGGSIDELNNVLSEIQKDQPPVVYWFANVPNDEEKLVDQVKKIVPNSILVTSKNNSGDRYTFPEIIARMLKVKANLTLVIHNEQLVRVSIVDPLGNVFLDNERHIHLVVSALSKRVEELRRITRIGSVKIGETILPDETEDSLRFVEIVKKQAKMFAELTPNVSTERMLGNASFRCSHGFPSMKQDDLIFVSKRNVDKTSINLSEFVAVSTNLEKGQVKYFGDNKPSVDTPIQVMLYKIFPETKYMIHGHVRIQGALDTNKIVPCGAINEVDEILNAVRNNKIEGTNFCVNLRGHGCIILADNLDYLESITYIGRSIRTQI